MRKFIRYTVARNPKEAEAYWTSQLSHTTKAAARKQLKKSQALGLYKEDKVFKCVMTVSQIEN